MLCLLEVCFNGYSKDKDGENKQKFISVSMTSVPGGLGWASANGMGE